MVVPPDCSTIDMCFGELNKPRVKGESQNATKYIMRLYISASRSIVLLYIYPHPQQSHQSLVSLLNGFRCSERGCCCRSREVSIGYPVARPSLHTPKEIEVRNMQLGIVPLVSSSNQELHDSYRQVYLRERSIS